MLCDRAVRGWLATCAAVAVCVYTINLIQPRLVELFTLQVWCVLGTLEPCVFSPECVGHVLRKSWTEIWEPQHF